MVYILSKVKQHTHSQQRTPASSPCPQFSISHPLRGQSHRDLSCPVHLTTSMKMGPLPAPKWAFPTDVPRSYPSILQATVASLLSHESSQIVPQTITQNDGL